MGDSGRRRCLLVALALAGALIVATPAGAQPLLDIETDWTLRTGNAVYGVEEWHEVSGGSYRFTRVWFGSQCVYTQLRPTTVVALATFPPAALLLLLAGARPLSRRGPGRSQHR